jgi:glucosamine--fructose-6-phosphate aminotransferase (isomerizing)
VLGLGDKANYIASDGMALAGMAEQIVYLEDGDWATVSGKEIEIRDAHGALVRRPARTTPRRAAIAGKGGYRHFMKKEIHEQPRVIRETLSQYLQPAATGIYLENLPLDFADVNRLQIVACGTSYHAGMITRYWAEKYARLPVDVETASEFCYREPVLAENGVSLFISQSGETADTLSALRYAKAAGQKIVALVNTPESTMAREADIVLHTLAGPEIGVASTKAFTTQLSVLACLTIAAGRQRGALDAEQASRLVTALNTLPSMIESVSADDAPYLHAAGTMRDTVSAIFVGRGSAYPTAIEGALKLKEISYIHAEGLGAGELKHGPIALVDATMPVVVIAPPDELFAKTHSNLREISARGANILLVSTENGIEKVGADAANTLMVPDCDPFVAPILYSVPLQLLSYHVASLKGTDIDQPRNLAKSVTVE